MKVYLNLRSELTRRANSFVIILSQRDFFTELNGEFLVNEDLTVRPRLVNPSVVFICKNCPLPIHNARGEAHNRGCRKATLKTPQKNGRVFFISLTKLC